MKRTAIMTAKSIRLETARANNYIFYVDVPDEIELDSVDKMLDEFIRCSSTCRSKFKCALDIWRAYQNVFPLLAKLAKSILVSKLHLQT